jgi:tetratricopeptide (TPR) repeat protein
MKKLSFLFLLSLLAAAAPARAQDSYGTLTLEDRQKLLEQYYGRAMELYNEKNYSRAIVHWKKVLNLDPDQTAAQELIKDAQSKLSDQIKPLEAAVELDIAAGKYKLALSKVDSLIEMDPSSEKWLDKKNKLNEITALIGGSSGRSPIGGLVRKALGAYLADQGDGRLAVNCIRYARDLNPTLKIMPRLVDFVESKFPEQAAKDKVTPGVNLVEHKLFLALNNIYDGRYDLAIFATNEVLELDPVNVLALKRKGSAYWALHQKEKARECWQTALKLAPRDAEIKNFLNFR